MMMMMTMKTMSETTVGHIWRHFSLVCACALSVRQRGLTDSIGRTAPGFLTHRQLLALLRGRDLGHVLFHDDDDGGWGFRRRRRRSPPDPNRFPKVPSEKGTELMHSGTFGSTDRHITSRKRLARRILDRELGIGNQSERKINQDIMAQVCHLSSFLLRRID